jgi:site-specific DNA recombinase
MSERKHFAQCRWWRNHAVIVMSAVVGLMLVAAFKDELDREGVASKARVDKFGRGTGGRPLARGALYLMLQNRIYRGEIVHKEASYPGEHPAIIDESLWEEVQRKLESNRVDRATGAEAAEPSLLAGLIFDGEGQRMTPSHANKKGTRYRYYVSRGLVTGSVHSGPGGCRVPANDLESLVEDQLRQFLATEFEVFAAIEPHVTDARNAKNIVVNAGALAKRWSELAPSEKRAILMTLVGRINLMRDTLEIRVLPGQLPAILEGEPRQDRTSRNESNEPSITFIVPARLKRTGMESRLLIDATAGARLKPDHSLRRILAQAWRYNAMVMGSGGRTMAELAAEAGIVGSYFARVLRLSFLAPEVVKAILHDRHPITLSAKRLANEIRIPMAWDEQRRLLTTD